MKPDYYYAGGRRIVLELAPELTALDLGRLAPASPLATAVRKYGTALRRKVYLVERDRLPPSAESRIAGSGAEQPVYRHGDAILVVLPEVRVETAGEAERGEVTAWAHQPGIRIVASGPGPIVIEPESGLGADALMLANRIHEDLGVQSAQPRMIRIVKAPGAAPARTPRTRTAAARAHRR